MSLEPAGATTTARASIVDLFAGPGGLDVAAHWLGVPVHGVEWDDNACATRRAAGLGTTHGDVREWGPADFPDATVLTGGPPCQTFTVAGGGAGRRALDDVLTLVKRMAAGEDVAETVAAMDDERTGLVLEPLRWALEANHLRRPFDTIVLEQVPAVLPVWAAVREALERIGYRAHHGILHTEDFGVPQTRRRAILIARRHSQPYLPAPTHRRFVAGRARTAGNRALRPWATMGEALTDRPGDFTVVSNYGTGGDPKARGLRRSDEPAATVTGKIRRNKLVGPGAAEDDRFSLAEAGRLQTFPLDFPWSGNDVAQQIGNAIPPRLGVHVLAAALGHHVDVDVLDEVVAAPWGTIVPSLVRRDDVDSGSPMLPALG